MFFLRPNKAIYLTAQSRLAGGFGLFIEINFCFVN